MFDAVPTAILGVEIFDSERGTLEGPFDVLLRDGRIAVIAPPDPSHAVGMTVIDGVGKTLLPGLVDVHVHLGAEVAMPGKLRIPDPKLNVGSFAMCGVTTVLDLATPMTLIERLRKKIDAGKIAGPQIFGTGRPFTAPGGHPVGTVARAFPSILGKYAANHMAWQVVTADDVDRDLVREWGRDALKVVLDDVAGEPSISDEALARLVTASRALELPLLAHVGRPVDVDRAVAAGVSALMHAPYGGALSDATLAALVDQKIPVVPTMSVWQDAEDVAAGHIPLDDLARSVLTDREERDLAEPRAHAPVDPALEAWDADLVAHHDDRVSNVTRLHDAGATLLIGSDSPFLGLAGGASTHQEIDRLEAAGLTPAEALTAATWTNSRFLDANAEFGAIRVGWQADLLLVDGDPIADPPALHRIVAVWTDGRAVDRAPR